MHYFHGFWGGLLIGLGLVALCTRVNVPLGTSVANTIANKTAA